MKRNPWFVMAALLMLAGAARAQETAGLAQGASAPRFLVASSATARREVEPSSVPILRRRVSLKVRDVPASAALAELGRQTGVLLSYDPALKVLERRLTVNVEGLTFAAALTEVLFDAALDVLVSDTRHIALIPRRAKRAADVGSIAGRVTDARNGDPIVGAEVMLDGSRSRTVTGDRGYYRLADVEAGSYTLAVRRVGFAKQSRAITVVATQELGVDFALQPVVTQLNDIVTTATGEQRLLELGHTVGRINADSLVRVAPVMSVTDLLSARIPGLLVQPQQGTVGGDVKIRIRGPNSIQLTSDPVIVVDGVRYRGTADFGARFDGFVMSGFKSAGYLGEEPTSRLNDLNPNDIEAIEVVKGPSAAALYGTDAANGVIVITTKQGRAGPASWRAYARATTSRTPQEKLPDVYWGWSANSFNCTLPLVSYGYCVQDSVTMLPNVLRNADSSIIAESPRWQYGTNVSGGSQELRYFISGDFENATGSLKMPPAYIKQLEAARGTKLTPEQLRPNAFQKINLRSNVAARLGRDGTAQINAGYTRNDTRALAGIGNPYVSAPYASPTRPYGSDPKMFFLSTSTERVNRFSGNVAADWRPAQWLSTRASVGLDLANSHRYFLSREIFGGLAGDIYTTYMNTTADLGATASTKVGRLTSRTSVGVQYNRNRDDQASIQGIGLPPGAGSPTSARTIRNTSAYDEKASLGGYVEEVVGLNERLFLSGSVRLDGASGFGQDYNVAVYPKIGVSWLVTDEPWLPRVPGLDELRLRYAFGNSGQQAWAEWVRPGYRIDQVVVGGVSGPALSIDNLGNPDLKPERIQEQEVGLDLVALNSRVKLSLTYDTRKTRDMLTNAPVSPGLGYRWANVGLVTGHGFEAQLTARALDHSAVSVDLTFSHSYHTSVVRELGQTAAQKSPDGGGWVEGYQLGAMFSLPLVSYEDANGDGIITDPEIVLGGESILSGLSIPPQSQTLGTIVGLFRQRLRISTLFERQSGHARPAYLFAVYGRALVDPTTPLGQQAELVAENQNYLYSKTVSAAFVRFRELSVAFDLPSAWLRPLRLNQATLSLAARNLGLWTDFPGDPESTGAPQARVWTTRFDVGF